MTRGKFVLIPFPYDDLSHEKIRPVLCLTNPIGEYEHIIAAFISSKIKLELKDSDLIINNQSDFFNTTGLKVSSTIHLHRLITVSRNLMINEIGTLPPGVLNIALEKVKAVFS